MSLFRRGSWAFGRQGQRSSEGDGTSRSLIEDESFDMGSNLAMPVYMSRQEAGEWMYPLDENGQPVEIIEDNEEDDKLSDVASSVVSSSTVGESREFWLNCLKENGVDMSTSLPHSSPRKSIALSTKGSVSPPRSVKPLASQDDNSMRHSDANTDDDEPSTDIGKQYSLTSSISSNAYDTLQNINPSEKTEGAMGAHREDCNKLEPELSRQEQNLSPSENYERKTLETLTYIPSPRPSLDSLSINDNRSPEQRVGEVILDRSKPDDSISEFKRKDDTVSLKLTSSDKTECNNGHAPFDESGMVCPNNDFDSSEEEHQEYAKSSKIQVFTVTSEDTTDSVNQTSETFSKHSRVQVLTKSSEESDHASVASEGELEYCASHDTNVPAGVEDLLSNSLDYSPFVDDSMEMEDTMHRWIPPKSTEYRHELPEQDIQPIVTSAAESTEEDSSNPKATCSNPINDGKDPVPSKGDVTRNAVRTVNLTEGRLDPNDPNSWMYLFWYRKGLMKKLPGNHGENPLQIQTNVKSTGRNSNTPKSTPIIEVPDTIKTKNGAKSNNEPLVTPREAFVTLDYKALRASGDDLPKRARRSLPANIRSSAQKEGGRKSFENIMKMWRNKSDDRPNSFFSPEQYMEDRDRSHDPSKSRPTQHSQLLSIAERTAAFEKGSGTSKPRLGQGDVETTPKQSHNQDVPSQKRCTPSGASASTDSPYPVVSPARELTIDDQLQRPPKRLSSGKRRMSQPVPPSDRSSEKGSTDNQRRRETINPKDHFRRHISRSHSDYKTVVKNDYKSVVRTFLASVEEHKELGEPKTDEIASSLSGIDSIPHESIDELDESDVITPRNADIDQSASSSGKQSAAKDSPWTQQVVQQLERVPVGSGDKKNSWREERPWREDVMKRRVSGFSDCSVVSASDEGPCQCSSSVFSGNDELIDFFLPQMGMACNCGKRVMGLRTPEEPTSLENILRPWQVIFLAAFGIHRGDQLVKAHHRSAKALANALRQYRRKHGMTPFRTKSCGMALQIWSKTSKAYVRSIRKQLTSGTNDLKVPNTLYIISSFLEKMHEMHSPMPRNTNTVHEDEASV